MIGLVVSEMFGKHVRINDVVDVKIFGNVYLQANKEERMLPIYENSQTLRAVPTMYHKLVLEMTLSTIFVFGMSKFLKNMN